jgi:hypothetical protein
MMTEHGIGSTFAWSFRIDLDGFEFALALPECACVWRELSFGYLATVVASVLGLV